MKVIPVDYHQTNHCPTSSLEFENCYIHSRYIRAETTQELFVSAVQLFVPSESSEFQSRCISVNE